MINKDIKEKAREMFDERFYPIDMPQKTDNEFESGKFWGRKECLQDVSGFIDQIIDLAIAEERKRVVEMIKNTQGSYVEDPFGNHKQGFFKEDIIKLITNTK